jgi:ABC-2 type transport system ATP-binding protein
VLRPEPLLVAHDVRIDVAGVPACDGLAFRTNGEHVLLLGAPRALFEATTGLAKVVRGTLAVRGTASAQAAVRGVVAGAPQDPPLPPRWTVAEYVQWSARLAGVPASEARASAEVAIAKLQLGALAKTETSRLVPHARRATTVAAALATSAEVIVLDDPLGGLLDDVAAMYARVLAEALADRAWLVFAPRLPLTSPLAEQADEAIVATAFRIEAQGAPAELTAGERRFVVRFDGPVDAALPALAIRGAKLEVHGAHHMLDLGREMTTSELMAICDEANIAVVELLPVVRALT